MAKCKSLEVKFKFLLYHKLQDNEQLRNLYEAQFSLLVTWA